MIVKLKENAQPFELEEIQRIIEGGDYPFAKTNHNGSVIFIILRDGIRLADVSFLEVLDYVDEIIEVPRSQRIGLLNFQTTERALEALLSGQTQERSAK